MTVVLPHNLIRCSGLALALAGGFQALGAVLHPDSTGHTPYFRSSLWAPSHALIAASFLLAIFGLMGLYLRQREETGVLGLAAFLLAVAGSTLLVGVALAEAYLLPVFAANQPPQPLAEWLDLSGPLGGPYVLIALASLVSLSLGFILLGVATMRAGVLPRRAGLLLAIGTALTNAEFFGPIGFILYVVGAAILGAALVWLGYALWSEPTSRVEQHHAA